MKLFRRALPILGILATTFAFLPTQSLAHDYPHERIYRHMHRRHEQVFRRVPHHIYYSSRVYYQPYYSGRVYYRPHHHYHVAYRFPVYVGGGVVYRPAYYCGDHLFVSASFGGGGRYYNDDYRYYDDGYGYDR
jgi:hypothetical protein